MKLQPKIIAPIAAGVLLAAGAAAFFLLRAQSPLQAEISKGTGANWSEVARLALEADPAAVDSSTFEGKPLMAWLIEYYSGNADVSGQIASKLVAKGAKFIFDGPDKYVALDLMIDKGMGPLLGQMIDAKLGTNDAAAYLPFFKENGYDYAASKGRLAKFFIGVGDPKALDALVADQGYNGYLLGYAASKNDLAGIAAMLATGYALSLEDFVPIATSGNLAALKLCLDSARDIDFGAVLEKAADTMTREALLVLYPRVENSFDVDSYVDRMIALGKYDCAAYMIDFGGLIGPDRSEAFRAVSAYLSQKAYAGSSREYTEADLELPAETAAALDTLGVSPQLLLRNEIFARKGYVATNPALAKIMNGVSWYKPASGITASDLSPLERKNVLWVRSLEAERDAATVVTWLDEKEYAADDRIFNREEDYRLPPRVVMSLGNLGINPSAMLRAEIYARAGLSYEEDAKLGPLLSKAIWYSPLSDLKEDIAARLGDSAKANVLLLQCREWIEILDAQKQTLPETVKAVPVVGYNTLFVKRIDAGGTPFTISTSSLSYAVAADASLLAEKRIGVPAGADGIGDAALKKIKAAKDPEGALSAYFAAKKYRGLTDTYVFKPEDMAPPPYLEEAVAKLGVNWTAILRKEIHARHGAIFSEDTLSGRIFTAMPWYSAKYSLVDSTPSRLPAIAGVNEVETLNFLLMEGQDLAELMGRRAAEGVVAFDTGGNSYAIRLERVSLDSRDGTEGGSFYVGYGFRNADEGGRSIGEIIMQMVSDFLPPIPEAYYEEGRCG